MRTPKPVVCDVHDWHTGNLADAALEIAIAGRDNVALALFDAVINNTDRKIGHLLPDQTGHLFACDHGVTFHVEDKLRTVLWQWAGDALTAEEFRTLDQTLDFIDSHSSILSAHLTEEEIEATRTRIHALRTEGIMPLPSEDWPAIPWPAY